MGLQRLQPSHRDKICDDRCWGESKVPPKSHRFARQLSAPTLLQLNLAQVKIGQHVLQGLVFGGLWNHGKGPCHCHMFAIVCLYIVCPASNEGWWSGHGLPSPATHPGSACPTQKPAVPRGRWEDSPPSAWRSCAPSPG